MRALVTGGAGQLGRALLATAPAGATVLAPTRAELDITDAAAVERVLAAQRPDLVINAAAYTAVDQAEKDEALARAVNGVAPGILANEIGRAHV